MADGDYDFSRFSDRSFEQLVQSLAIRAIGIPTIVFGDGKDGGREATFDGKSRYIGASGQPWNGYHVIQAKFRLRTDTRKSDSDWAVEQLRSELQSYINRPDRRRPQYYILATNVVLSPVEKIGGVDRARALLDTKSKELGIIEFDIWDYDKLRALLDNNADVRRAYAHLTTPGDVLSGALDILSQMRQSGTLGRLAGTENSFANLDELLRDSTLLLRTRHEIVPTDLPPLPEICVTRASVVNSLRNLCMQFPVTFVYGTPGSGKSQLARLVAQFIDCRAWIRFRDLTEGQATTRLDAALVAINGDKPQADIVEHYAKAITAIGKGNLIVLDDLPRLTTGSEFVERFCVLGRACSAAGVRALVTSMHMPPAILEPAIGSAQFHAVETPQFDDKDADELFRLFGAPDKFFVARRTAFINACAKGHPLILIAAARFLSQRNWQFTDSEFHALVRNHHTADLAPEVRARLMQIVPSEARDLLYRLNAIGAEFSEDDMLALAYVAPQIPRPAEQLANLLGYCVQRETTTMMSVSPVFQVLGTVDLPPEVSRSCHALMGERILSGDRLTPILGWRAIGHFNRAGRPDQAATVLLSALHALKRAKRDTPDYGMLSIWISQPMPTEIRLGIRILVRAFQIVLHAKRGIETQFLMQDLAALTEVASPADSPWLLAASATAGISIAERDFALACRLWQRAVTWLPDATWPDGKPPKFPADQPVERGTWMLARQIKTRGDLHTWIEVVDSFTSKQRSAMLNSADGFEFSLTTANRLWLVEFEKQAQGRDWGPVQAAMDDLAKAARRWGTEILWACAKRVQIIVLGEFLKDIKRCEDAAVEALGQASNDPRVQFTIEESLGTQFFVARRTADARDWLLRAVSHPISEFWISRFFAHLRLSHVLGDADAVASVRHAEAAVALAKAHAADDPIPEIDLIKALAELAIAHHLAGDQKAAFVAWEDAGQRLLTLEIKTDDEKDTAVVFGHVSGYLSTFARMGRGPDSASDGGVYGAPYRGVFATSNPKRIELYKPDANLSLQAHLTMFAMGVGNEPRAKHWAEETIVGARKSQRLSFFSAAGWDLIALYTKGGRFEDAIAIAIEVANISAAGIKLRKPGWNIDTRFCVEAVLGPKSNPEWLTAEREAMLVLCAPLVAHLGLLAIVNSETLASEAERAVAAIRRYSATGLDRDGWEAFAVILERGFLNSPSEEHLVAFGNTFDQHVHKGICVAAYLCAGLRDRGNAERALRGQLAVMPFVDTYFSHFLATHPLVVHFVAEYWRDAVARMPFRFSAPRVLKQQLEAANQSSGSARLRLILSLVTTALGVRATRDERHWLSTGKMAPVEPPK